MQLYQGRGDRIMGLKMSSDFNKENQESEVKTNTVSVREWHRLMVVEY